MRVRVFDVCVCDVRVCACVICVCVCDVKEYFVVYECHFSTGEFIAACHIEYERKKCGWNSCVWHKSVL